MGVVVCRPGDGVWMMSDTDGLPDAVPCPFPWPCAPCAGAESIAFCCQQSRECLCLEKQGWQPVCRMPCVPGICDMRFSACGRYLYQLSSEADCIHALSVSTGELLWAAPAGVFPRCMKPDAEGDLILCACGAVNEALLLNAPELTPVCTIQTPHPCFYADFWQGGLVLVCAAESGDIQTVVYTLAPKKRHLQMILKLSGAPCGLCVCGDGRNALISTWNGLMKVDLRNGAIVWNRPEWALCARMECRGDLALISDTLDGSVCVFHHQRPRERRTLTAFPDSQACFL